jgi:hypothetical protein
VIQCGEVSRREVEQDAILEAGPTGLANGPHRVPDEQSAKWSRQGLMEQDAHGS